VTGNDAVVARARATLWAMACGQDARLTGDEAVALWTQLNDHERNLGLLRRRIEAATKDLHDQADRLVAQVLSEEQRANALQREIDSLRGEA